MSIPALLASYLAARAHHAEAGRQVLRAERLAEKLAKRAGGSDAAWARACAVAGFDLADHRSLAACRDVRRSGAAAACRRAFNALKAVLRGVPLATRQRVLGAVLCAELLAAANDH